MSDIDIVLKVPREGDPAQMIYLYRIDDEHNYKKISALISDELNSTEENSPNDKESIVLESLKRLNNIIKSQMEEEFFNIVYIMTYIDAVYHAINDANEPAMARAFANEAVRLLLGHFDLKTNLHALRSSVDYQSMQRFSAYPTTEGIPGPVQRDFICTAIMKYWPVQLIGRFPQNFEFSTFGDYSKLLSELYPDTKLHDYLKEHPKQAPQPKLVEYSVSEQEAFNELEQQLKLLHNKVFELRFKRRLLKEADSLETLYKNLSEGVNKCRYEKTFIPTFLKNSQKAIEEAKPKLDHYLDVKQVMKNIALAIAGLGLFYLIAIGINRTVNKRWLFFKTDSEQKVNAIEKTVNKISSLFPENMEEGDSQNLGEDRRSAVPMN